MLDLRSAKRVAVGLAVVGWVTGSVALPLAITLAGGHRDGMFVFGFLVALASGFGDAVRAIRRRRNPIEPRPRRDDPGFGFGELYAAGVAVAGVIAAAIVVHRYGWATLVVPAGSFLGLVIAIRSTRSLSSQRTQRWLDAMYWAGVALIGVILASGIPTERDERLGGLLLGGVAGGAVVVAVKSVGNMLRARSHRTPSVTP